MSSPWRAARRQSAVCPSLESPRRPHRPWLALLLPFVFALAGCGGGKGTVSGEVTYNGKPIPWGRITFVSQVGNQTVHSTPIIKGKYTIANCPVGLVKISIESIPAKAVDTSKIPPMMLERSKEAHRPEPPPDVIGQHLQIPLKYANPDMSGLEHTVEPGEKEHNIALKPE
jgi:hypothetical protein